MGFATTYRTALVALSPARIASWCQGPRCVGSVTVMGDELTDAGRHRGVQQISNRLRIDSCPTMSP